MSRAAGGREIRKITEIGGRGLGGFFPSPRAAGGREIREITKMGGRGLGRFFPPGEGSGRGFSRRRGPVGVSHTAGGGGECLAPLGAEKFGKSQKSEGGGRGVSRAAGVRKIRKIQVIGVRGPAGY